ncbi:hypothetical protein DEU56DRAFT_802148 [Suillus clintonianus]|uniref:uncharacterized protein n=1 Tax=Suillus clintonianus TaxID=1904413 RepID=UPI001B86FB2A|nr:uncharacterized protein DEU56DRAFT_802148 [Suillus clintonianus]KAG2138520.1 hypothetical protein DEU56DRAFT_802148 [Suillus clintonianus]
MLTHSQNVALSPLNFANYDNELLEALWITLTESAVEPMQAPVPSLINFAEDCLLCALVMLRKFDENVFSDDLPSEHELGAPWAEEPIGIVYITAAPAQSAAQEANVGIIISQAHQCKGFAREAVELALAWVFEDLKFHRVQAALMNDAQKDRAMRLFVGQGFTHEGTRRRSVLKPESGGVVGVWKDVTYLAMLDTEWALRNVLKRRGPAPTLWDEMFARHTREREEMVKWDEKHNRIRKVSSTETLRHGEVTSRQPTYIIDPWFSDLSSSSSQTSCYGSVPPSPNPGAADISKAMREYLDFGESRPRWNPLEEEIDDVSRQSSPSPYNLSVPGTPIPIPPRSPSVPSSVSEFESEDESEVEPSWRAFRRIPSSDGSSSSSHHLSWAQRPLSPIIRPESASGGSESESWSDASDGGPDGSGSGSDWDMMSEPEQSS